MIFYRAFSPVRGIHRNFCFRKRGRKKSAAKKSKVLKCVAQPPGKKSNDIKTEKLFVIASNSALKGECEREREREI